MTMQLKNAMVRAAGDLYWRETKELWNLPLVFLVLLLLCFSEWWLRRKWGIV